MKITILLQEGSPTGLFHYGYVAHHSRFLSNLGVCLFKLCWFNIDVGRLLCRLLDHGFVISKPSFFWGRSVYVSGMDHWTCFF